MTITQEMIDRIRPVRFKLFKQMFAEEKNRDVLRNFMEDVLGVKEDIIAVRREGIGKANGGELVVETTDSIYYIDIKEAKYKDEFSDVWENLEMMITMRCLAPENGKEVKIVDIHV